MKKALLYEAGAMLIGTLGAVVLVTGLMPFINPVFVDLHAEGEYSPRLSFLVPTLLALPILGAAWRLNQKAQQFRHTAKSFHRPKQDL